MRLSVLIIGSILSTTVWSGGAIAGDCGFPPTEEPLIVDGRTASRDEIQLSIQAVRIYSEIVNDYLNCLDSQRAEIFLNMTTEQQDRWTEDYNKVVDRLTEFETGINQQIRVFNSRTNLDDPNGNSP